jgi:hypothetical protein
MSLTPILLLGIVAASVQASPLIQSQVSTVGTTGTGATLFRYNYMISGFALFQNEEIDIRFDRAVFGQLSNGVAGPGFDLLLFQPNQPIGAFGDYSALAGPNASLTGTFSVDFTLAPNVTLKPNDPRLVQELFLFDDNPGPPTHPGVPFEGLTSVAPFSSAPDSSAPEPWSVSLCGAALVAGGARWVLQRLARKYGLRA